MALRASACRSYVIASQCAHWRGNPPDIPETFGDRHTSDLNCGMIATGNHLDFDSLRDAPRSLVRDDSIHRGGTADARGRASLRGVCGSTRIV